MERVQFAGNLLHATDQAVHIARAQVRNWLPDAVRYFVRWRQDVDGQLLNDRVKWFRGADGKPSLICDLEAVLGRLYVNGSVPLWVDVNAEWVDERFTYLRLSYSNRFVAEDMRLRYKELGAPPFHCLGPCLPYNWTNRACVEKFDLRNAHCG